MDCGAKNCRFSNLVLNLGEAYLSHAFPLIKWDQGQQEVQTGGIFLSQLAEPVSCAAVVLLPGLYHTHPSLGHCISWLLAKYLAQMSARCLNFTCSRWSITEGVRVAVNKAWQVQFILINYETPHRLNHDLLTRSFPVTAMIPARKPAAKFGKVILPPLAKSMST